jgi:hypothetical protein
MGRILPPRGIFKLVKTLDDLGMTGDTIERVCEQAKVPLVHEVKFDKASWFVWREVVSKIERNQAGAIEMIDVVFQEVKGSEALSDFKIQIKTAKTRRQDKIAQALKDGTCVLFLGPEVLRAAVDDKTKSFNAHFCDFLEQEMDVDRTYYDRGLRENLTYMAQCRADGDDYLPGENGVNAAKLYKTLKDDESFDTQVFEYLARLPLKLVINANADDLLLEALRNKQGVTPSTSYYDLSNHEISEEEDKTQADEKIKAKEKNDTEQGNPETVISAEQPFIYNVFGSFGNVDSVLFTESQFMYFITSVIDGDPPLDGEVMTELIKKDTYLFLGFDFEQWYFKILFELFKLKKEEFAAMSIGYGAGDGAEMAAAFSVFNQEFFEREFKIYFVADDIRKFIAELLKRLS